MTAMSEDPLLLDVVGIGALNIDYIATREKLADHQRLQG
jgi:hypothetical protein